MPEESGERKIFTLLEVTSSIRNTISGRYQSVFWVKAEMNRLNHYPHSGHCYPELVQKSGSRVIAEMKAVIWREDFLRINAKFLKILKEPLKNGINILFAARITFDPVYGLSLTIIDIDPSYSLGDLEMEKAETIIRLREEGLFDRNRQLSLPLLPKRIAVISVQTSKGYADFMSILGNNGFGYRIFTMLFPAVLQGEKAVESILYQLSQIMKVKEHFDAIAIIRGGGGDVGLNCYNNYDLASAVALSPLPVLTGIGHSTNETVAEMVAFRNAITPTELAGFIIQAFHDFAVPLNEAEEKISNFAGRIILNERNGLIQTSRYFKSVTSGAIERNGNVITAAGNSLRFFSNLLLKEQGNSRTGVLKELIRQIPLLIRNQESLVNHLSEKTILLDPKNILKRGYSITRFGNKSILSAGDVSAGDVIETELADGVLKSTIISKN